MGTNGQGCWDDIHVRWAVTANASRKLCCNLVYFDSWLNLAIFLCLSHIETWRTAWSNTEIQMECPGTCIQSASQLSTRIYHLALQYVLEVGNNARYCLSDSTHLDLVRSALLKMEARTLFYIISQSTFWDIWNRQRTFGLFQSNVKLINPWSGQSSLWYSL